VRLLFDTHALLWLLRGDERLPGRVREMVLSAGELFFSTVTLWEVGLKLSRSGFDFEVSASWQTVIPAKCELFGVRHLAIEAPHCRAI
jgi:PIN domain nuclease of toxin-antitoxin system